MKLNNKNQQVESIEPKIKKKVKKNAATGVSLNVYTLILCNTTPKLH